MGGVGAGVSVFFFTMNPYLKFFLGGARGGGGVAEGG